MGLFERIKSALGFGASTSGSRASTPDRSSPGEETTTDGEPATGSTEASTETESSDSTTEDVDVTVEHEPDGADDRGPDAATEKPGADDHEPDTDAEDAVKGTDTGATTGADLQDVKGIGPTYAERLREAGVEGVDDLAGGDAAAIAEASGIAESRVQKWIDRAKTY